MSRILMVHQMKNMSMNSDLFRSITSLRVMRVFRKCFGLYVSFSFSMYCMITLYWRGTLLGTTGDIEERHSPHPQSIYRLFGKKEIHLNYRAVYGTYHNTDTFQMLWTLKGGLTERNRNFKRCCF